MAKKITTLHPENDPSTDLYPNIVEENLPVSTTNDINTLKSKVTGLSSDVAKNKVAVENLKNEKLNSSGATTRNVTDTFYLSFLGNDLVTILDDNGLILGNDTSYIEMHVPELRFLEIHTPTGIYHILTKEDLSTAEVLTAKLLKESDGTRTIGYDSLDAESYEEVYGDRILMQNGDGNIQPIKLENIRGGRERSLSKKFKHTLELTNANGNLFLTFVLEDDNGLKIESITDLLAINQASSLMATGGFKTAEGYSVIASNIKWDVNGIMVTGIKINGGVIHDYLLNNEGLTISDTVSEK